MNTKARFFDKQATYSLTDEQITAAWQELSAYYNGANRNYHNLTHLEALFSWYDSYHSQLQASEIVNWSIWYHDIVYNAKRRDNEEQSALLAQQRLLDFGIPQEQVNKIIMYIRATAQHLSVEAKGDLAYFLDFDLAILGSERLAYEAYATAVRQEYAHVPGFLYRRGRKKVLRYFLKAERLYRTDALHDLLEEQARKNLEWELRAYL